MKFVVSAFLVLATCLLLLAASSVIALRAQVATPTFRAGTTLVEFTVVAQDSKGNAITDLTREDLVLTDKGQVRDVAFFRFDGGPAPVADAPAVPPPAGFTTNRPDYLPAPQWSVTAIVLDLLNTALPDQMSARAQTLKYLRNLSPNTYAGLFRFSEDEPITTLQTFTDRLDLLRARVESLKGAPRHEFGTHNSAGAKIIGGDCSVIAGGGGGLSAASSGGAGVGTADARSSMTEAEQRALSAMNEQLRDRRLSRTLSSLEALGNYLAAIPGRKNLVWITSGMPIVLREKPNVQSLLSYERQIRETAQRLANQGIAVYAVDAKGGCRAGDTSTDQGPDGSNDAPQHVFASLGILADVTGGRLVKYNNDPTLALTLAANDQRGTYTLGFYAPDEPAALTDQWHSLNVEVKRKAVTLHHRQGYISVARSQPHNLAPAGWNGLAFDSLGSTAIRLNGRTVIAGNQAAMSLQVAAGDLYFHEKDGQVVADLEIGLVEKTEKGPSNVRQQPMTISLRDPSTDQQSQLIPLKTMWPINPATTSVRAIVRDRFSGRYGTLEMSVDRN